MKTYSDGHAPNSNLYKPCRSTPYLGKKTSTSWSEVEQAKIPTCQRAGPKMLSPPLSPLLSEYHSVLQPMLDSAQLSCVILEDEGGSRLKRENSALSNDEDFKTNQTYSCSIDARNQNHAGQTKRQTVDRGRPPDTDGRTSPETYELIPPSPSPTCEGPLDWDCFSDQTAACSNSSSCVRSNLGPENSCFRPRGNLRAVLNEGNPLSGISKAVGSGPSSENAPSKGKGTGQTASRKRDRKTAIGEASSSDLDDERSPATRRRTEETDKGPESLLACPFYKRDSLKYQKCLHYQLRRIKDVKQHITRQHSQPDFYCARCYDIFGTAEQRDEHARCTSCEIRNPPHFDGVSAETKKTLNKQYNSRGKSVVEQWHDMWEIIFPGASWPASVYVGNYIEEVIGLLRAVWKRRGSDIVSRVVDTNRPGGLDGEDLNCTIGLLLDSLGANAGPAGDASVETALPKLLCESQTASESSSSLSYISVSEPHDEIGYQGLQERFPTGLSPLAGPISDYGEIPFEVHSQGLGGFDFGFLLGFEENEV